MKERSEDAHTLRFYFWKNRYNPLVRSNDWEEGYIMDWEDKICESYEAALRHISIMNYTLVKVFNKHGILKYCNQYHVDPNQTYA